MHGVGDVIPKQLHVSLQQFLAARDDDCVLATALERVVFTTL